ncbi:MAG: hypothetical protein KME49_14505 [Brasilonema octagenarum HA4186-MV1]|jgi:hypothetical protein|uniref:Uncharacterized protein n=2 Tax=Brasilonema TaxID=383614 RepID=A0A856MD92_9CYAN|nr:MULTISPECIES: hypothetical protein [Brasilonema]MBW4626668.1 hypothetical protein [Brasilonema octagenarum HA4186-MV1]NMF63708.1 hypothetical protein [Brasilonema octagenarum UFV-OR1]QDL07671.1 hypothetical protein DP114_06965 [Brasilonema sennae CENA114]QDL14033.1 hypothetical protein DP113_06925 [Brasilonema octagenarum UFV-E1]
MDQLEIIDLDFCEVVTEEDLHVTGGLRLADLFNLLPQLEGYEVTDVSSDDKSVIKKLSKPGVVGYEVLTDDGKFKSRSVTLFANNSNGTIAGSFIRSVSST